MAGIKEAGHAEYNPDTSNPLLIPVSCPVDNRPDNAPKLWGKLNIKLRPGSMAHRIYRENSISEPFTCNYELNPAFRAKLESAGLKVSGETEDGGARIIELSNYPFFIGTGFVPQLSSELNKPHPLIVAFLQAAVQYRQK